jgi:hypothetical protein
MKDPFYTYGPPELCGWRVESLGKDDGIFWLQTTDRRFGRKLGKRQDTEDVAIHGWNHFRQTYEMRGSWRKVKRLIDRYILSARDSFLGVNRMQNTSNLAGSVIGTVMDNGRELSAGDCISTKTNVRASSDEFRRREQSVKQLSYS